ncbi:LacI family DNA-binding transcriptional regulator [Parasphingorhabdus cellanae]|uniref:LacI family DNA-binding transcriptional regulator n=1 Tax=Parasphingorhabdus cellanae TaxID=2806553 RepID=A0ABX7T0Z8_9SPHN|nr:LacI family DNA-binding transcriptional regulator [Parasphingorhabdus cellanae]QTD55210.1 LacI family DNA-binding transcriptional regulator [Parasphingorhabdus cellanae]
MENSTTERPHQRATMIDVAKDAGVSFKTVSRVLNGESNVREETRQLVMSAAERLNYKLNVAARSLRVGGPQIIALLVQNPSRSYIESVHLGALQRCHKTGMHLIMEECEDGLAEIEAMIDNTSPVGVVVTPPLCDDPDLIKMLDTKKIRYVLIAPRNPSATQASININDESAAEEMTRHLLSLGHKRIGFIKGHPDHSVSAKRYAGYSKAMQAAALEIAPELVEQGEFSWASGLAAAEKLLDLPNPPSAVFASNDDMAAAVIAAAYRRNIHVPNDLSVVGFDNTQVAAVISPQLTTVNQPIADLVSEAVGLLTDQTFQSGDRSKPIFLDHHLVKRESAGPAKAEVSA